MILNLLLQIFPPSSDFDPKGLQTLRIGAINIKGAVNTPFLHDFLDSLDICCISEHWLDSFDLGFLDNFHPLPMRRIQFIVLLDIKGVMEV